MMASFLRIPTSSAKLLRVGSRGLCASQTRSLGSLGSIASSYNDNNPHLISAKSMYRTSFSNQVRHEATWTTTTSDAVISHVEPITGAILPFASLNFLQVCFLPVTYGLMYFMDFMLNYMPWWAAILTGTVTARLLLFPAHLKTHIIGIKTYNLLPETQRLQAKINESLSTGDSYNIALNRTKLSLLYKENNMSMTQRLAPALIQIPIYASYFFLLRQLGAIPVESMLTGGALWFTNLTVPDPYYILPALTCLSMLGLIETGFGVSPSAMTPLGRYAMRALPVGLFFFIQSFPAGVALFWSTSNTITLIYSYMLRQKWAKKAFNIPERLVHDREKLPLTQQSFSSQWKNAVENSKKKRDVVVLRRLDNEAFKKAGIGPIPKTYKEPPKHN